MTFKPAVLISVNTSWNIYHFRAGLIEALKREGYYVVSAAPEDVYTPRLRSMVDEHISLPMDNAGTSPLRDIALFWRYLRVIRKVKPAVMLSYTIKPNIYGSIAARMLGVPVIANISGLGTAFLRRNWLTYLVKRLYRAALRCTARVFFQNPEDQALFIRMKLVDSVKTDLLPGSGIDLQHFSPSPSAPVGSGNRFVLIARLLWDKGVGEYVAAARIVKEAFPKATFTLVGPLGVANRTAIPKDIVETWVAEGLITYLGVQDDVREIIAQHDCVVLPSYREGMSRVLLEASAMGKPMIATDVAGCRQIVEHGRNGLLCQPQDAQSLADMMRYFMACSAAERARMGRESRLKAEQEFDEALVFERYLNVIAGLIAAR